MNQKWDWDFFEESGRQIVVHGLVITVEVTVLASLLAFALGLVFAIFLRSRFWVVRAPVRAFVEFVRSTPLLVQLYFIFFVFPGFGLVIPAFWTGVFGLGIHFSTYCAEVYRAGIDGVPRGQWEAATALSIPRRRVWLGVILPQAVPRVVPALGNYVISMFKYVPLTMAISLLGILGVAKDVGGTAYRYVEPYTIAGLLFLVLSYPSSILVRRLERRFGHGTGRAPDVATGGGI